MNNQQTDKECSISSATLSSVKNLIVNKSKRPTTDIVKKKLKVDFEFQKRKEIKQAFDLDSGSEKSETKPAE